MHRLIGDQLLKKRGRRLPRDRTQVQKAEVEPMFQDFPEVPIQAGQFRGLLGDRKKLRPKINQELNTLL